ncbi:Xylose isomerase-like TIM barrel [uncultured archaeon]|nr:Xylose isomerase-like TIM barrel [uncultured archaeon]
MKIGFPNHPRKDILEEIEWIGKNGFDFIDFFLEEDKAVPEKIDIEKAKTLLKKYGLATVGHTAWYLPIGSPIKSIRNAAVAEAAKYFAVFGRLGVKFVTIHSNWLSGMFSSEEGVKFQVESLRKLVEEAKKYNIGVMYEPVDTPSDNVENVSAILDKVPGLFLHLDIGHANLFGKRPEDFIRKFHKRLKHVHLHDNDTYQDLHLPLGCGSTDWEKTIAVLKKYYNGTITLEVFSRDKDYVLLSKEKLRKLWNKI